MTENTVWKALWTIGAGVNAFLLLVVVALLAVGVIRLGNAVDELPNSREMASTFVDELVEAGWLTGSAGEADPLLQNRTIVMTHAINEHSSQLIVKALFQLDRQDPTKAIDLYLSSPGGWGGSAFTIVDAVQSLKSPVNTYALGLCYSSCALVLAAGTGQRSAAENAILMVHANLEDSSEPFSYDRIDRARYEKLWRDHGRLPDDWFPMTGDEAYYLTPRDALEYGIIDRIATRNK
jgi:ATP-dependent Clp protease protease subunit